MMTQLVDAMLTMGLTGETARSGRWIRFPGARGAACVVEAAWGNGYYAFYEDGEKDPAPGEPMAAAGALFLDPASAIAACLSGTAQSRAGAVRGGAVVDMGTGQPAAMRRCDACGAAEPAAMQAKATPARWGEVWLCEDCMRAGETALRGVPMS